MRASEVVTRRSYTPENVGSSPTPATGGKMVISPTVTMTGTYVLWLDAGGNDVGTYAISVLQGLQVLSFLVAIVLGLVVARLLPA